MKRHILLQMIGAVLLFAVWHQGWLLPIFTDDVTYISWGMATVFLLGVWLLPDRRIYLVDSHFIAGVLPVIGICGTIIGLRLAVQGGEGSDFALRAFGIDAALSTTIVGLVACVWIRVCRRLLG